MTETTTMREVSRIWADEMPEFGKRLRSQGFTVELGPGNHWEDAYHHVGRPVSTDAPKQVVIETMCEVAQEGDAPSEALRAMYAELQDDIPA